MNRYQQLVQNYLLQHPIQQSSDQEQKFQTFQNHRLVEIENQQEDDNNYLPSVKKFLSQPNPLMNKVQFTPYHPKCYYPHALSRLPKCLKDFSCIMIQKNNMNELSQAFHGYQRLKNDVLNLLVDRKLKRNIQAQIQGQQKTNIVNCNNNNSYLVTLEQYYDHKSSIYQRYSQKNMKLQENKQKLKYFSTYVLDMAKVIRKQMKFQQLGLDNHNHHHFNTQIASSNNHSHHNNNNHDTKSILSSRPSSVSRNNNFHIRQQKTSHLQNLRSNLQSHQTSRKQLHQHNLHSNTSNLQIKFDSNFESGNLFQAYQRQFNTYDLILQNDINTKGNTQWFFFSVKNLPKNQTVKFNIVNLSKCDALFRIGMKPYIFSMIRYQKRNVGWTRQGLKVQYKQSSQHKKQSTKAPYYVLSFQYKSIYEGDIVYFSQSIPYTLTDLSQFLNNRLKDKNLHHKIKIKNIGLTLGSNQVDLLEITNNQFINRHKKSVWIIARQHPGQTTSGFMMEGIIDFLIGDSQEAKMLLNNFVFKIVPMVNVDGVIHGNSRAQFIGTDPNRKWLNPHKLHNPIIHSIKHYIEKQKQNIELFLDLHSHSRKLGTFFYGNTLASNTASSRIYPLTVCKNDFRFTFKNCRFSGGSNSAARYALFSTLNIPLIYTVQSSFYGYQVGDHRIIQYLPKDYKQMGMNLMKSFNDYELKKNGKTLKLLKPISSIQQNFQEQIQDDLNDQQLQTSSVGSDQDPGADQYNEKQFKKLITSKDAKKKKKLKKKVKQPAIKIKLIQQTQLPKKPKTNNSQSYYKDYFSGRLSVIKKGQERIVDTINNKLGQALKKTMISFGIQVNLKNESNNGFLNKRDSFSQALQTTNNNGFTTNILTQRNNQQLINSKLGNLSGSKQIPFYPNNLCVIGQKVQQISIYGTTVGMQVSQNKQIFINRYEQYNNNNNSTNSTMYNSNRKSFSVRQRVNSFLQVKENNFLQRGDCMTKNFFSRK